MKNILVIGGSSGIGAALVERLAGEGNQVFASYHLNEKTNQNNVHFFKMDVREEILDFSFLPEQLDAIVYCPGSINLKPFARIKPTAFIADYELQVVGAIKTIQSNMNRLKKSDLASIVLFSTVAVGQGFNFHSQVSASKGAIEGLTKALAAEFSPKIRVNAIAPSITKTPLAEKLLNTEQKVAANAARHPLKRVGVANDIANAVRFLLSEESSWITGQILKVDGGMSSLRV